MLAELRQLENERIATIAFGDKIDGVHYWIDIRTSSRIVVRFEAREMTLDGVDFYTIDVALRESSGGQEYILDFVVDHIELVEREEWTEPVFDEESIGSNPVDVVYGRRGKAPLATTKVHTTSGVILHSSVKPEVLVFTADYPGLVGVCLDRDQIAEYASEYAPESKSE